MSFVFWVILYFKFWIVWSFIFATFTIIIFEGEYPFIKYRSDVHFRELKNVTVKFREFFIRRVGRSVAWKPFHGALVLSEKVVVPEMQEARKCSLCTWHALVKRMRLVCGGWCDTRLWVTLEISLRLSSETYVIYTRSRFLRELDVRKMFASERNDRDVYFLIILFSVVTRLRSSTFGGRLNW